MLLVEGECIIQIARPLTLEKVTLLLFALILPSCNFFFPILSPHLIHPSHQYLSFHHPFVCSSGEMLCPLCKSLVNTLVPHVPFAATKLLARRSISTLPPSYTSLSTTSTAMLVQPPDSTIPPSSSSSTLLSILAVPFVPQNWYHRIQQCQLLPSPNSTSESADGIAPAGSPLQRYFAQSNIAACVHTYDQALQALCGTTPPLPTRYIKLVIATKY